MDGIRKYLAEIGRRGGRKSRRVLDRDTARDMVRVREAVRAFRRFRDTCFAAHRSDLRIGLNDVGWVARQLRRHGNADAWRVAARLEPLSDTRPDAESIRLAALRRKTPAQRLREALEFSESVRSLALGRLRTRHPGSTDGELMELLRQA